MRNMLVLSLLSVLSAFVSGCGFTGGVLGSSHADHADVAQDILRSTPYIHKVSAGDILGVTVLGENDLSGSYPVTQDGTLALPLIGEVDVAGNSIQETTQTITMRLQDGFLVNPQVSVAVENLKPVYILGEVSIPSSYDYVTSLNITQAIALAGGHTHRANKNIYQVKRIQFADDALTENPSIENKAVDQVSNPARGDTVLHPGDTLIVKERFF